MKHRKKRNTGLLYEFLTKHAAERVVSGDKQGLSKTVKLLKKHIKEGSQLRDELRLFKSLMRSRVPNREAARRVVAEARNAARAVDATKLDREKSLLIRGINHTFGTHSIYDQRVDEYRLFATVQSLLDEWRRPVPTDVVALALQEDELVEHLVSPRPGDPLKESRDDVDELLVRMMAKRVDGKIKGVMNAEQLKLLDAHVIALRDGDMSGVKRMIENIRDATLAAMDGAKNVSDIVNEGLGAVRAVLKQPIDEVNDTVVARYLRIASLRAELMGENTKGANER